MESFELAALKIAQEEENWALSFERAKLMVIHEYGTLSWFIDVDGVADERLLKRFAATEDISISVEAVTIGGRRLRGSAYFHPNTIHSAAAIRGIGELQGYGQSLPR
ncbi:hypothetical protein [Cohnella thermotolerans]|jgi:hypothetical protein|uniref:hypothetical protein n=1 Tax=Cohnella thermotolerans TaxID=329858 RepID=UPI00047968F4|nr:hypothetical protein [Cohnella thermotolerans]